MNTDAKRKEFWKKWAEENNYWAKSVTKFGVVGIKGKKMAEKFFRGLVYEDK
jgi:hypothetical protein